MNFFRKRKREEEIEISSNEEEQQPKKKTVTRTVVSWFSELKRRVLEAATPNISRTAGVRYAMTPHAVFSPNSTSQRRGMAFYKLGDHVDVKEDRLYEFKSGGGGYAINVLPEHVRKYGSGFLNSNGGILLAGILDDGKVQGVWCNPPKKHVIIKLITKEFDKFAPCVRPDMYTVNFVPVSLPQSQWQISRGWREYAPDTYVIEIAIRAGDCGEIYEDGLHQVFIRREGSVEGPLNPLQIKDLVLLKYRQVIKDRKRKVREEAEKADDEPNRKALKYIPIVLDLTEKADNEPNRKALKYTPILLDSTEKADNEPNRKALKYSPIVFDLTK